MSFPGVRALDDVSLELRAGEVHGLVGENGAGKSTLINVLTGVFKPDEGHLSVHGKEVVLDNPASARRHGIAAVFQELSIQPWLSVTSNVVLGNEPRRGPGGQILTRNRAEELARKTLDRLGASEIPLGVRAYQLSTGQQRLVEIARALAVGAPIIVMDEPTSSLPDREADRLLGIIRQLRDDGTSVLLVSHRLDEIRSVADRVTVLRDGRLIVTAPNAELSTLRLVELMTGRRVDSLFPPRSDRVGDVVFKAEGLTRTGVFEDVSFEVRAGEIVGFAGLIGAGRTEVMRAIFGADPLDRGSLSMNGQVLSLRSPDAAIQAGIAYLPENRKEHGLVLNLPVAENMVMSTLRRFSAWGVVSRRKIRVASQEMADRLRIKGRLGEPVANLSGGNQQKVVIAKCLMTRAKLLIFDEPTQGIDVGAKYEVYSVMQELASQGAAIVLVSSELPEIVNVAHRAIVMSGGRISGEYASADFDEHTILSAAFAAHTSLQQGIDVA
jgi:ABC-type sugar transport system ATPase subunit